MAVLVLNIKVNVCTIGLKTHSSSTSKIELTLYKDESYSLHQNGMISLLLEGQNLLFKFPFLLFIPNRLSTMGKSASGLQPRCSTWCLTQAQQTCGCPRKAAPLFPLPVVSVSTYKPENKSTYSGNNLYFYYTHVTNDDVKTIQT